jgi:hypothetical protein
MRTINAGQQLAGVVGFLLLASPIAGALAAQRQAEQPSARQGPAPATSAKPVTARGCLRDASEVGGQGGGGQAWQGSIAGHLLMDVQIAPSQTSGSNTPSSTAPSTSANVASSQAPLDPNTPAMLLILGIAEPELRRYRGQQVEVRGIVGTTRDVSRTASGGTGGRGAGSPPNGQVAGETKSPKVGTGGSLRVPPSTTAAVTQRPTEFQATSIRSVARSCPSGVR